MKTVISIPIKKNSTRVLSKNFKNLGDKPLYSHLLDTIAPLSARYDIYVMSDSLEFSDICSKYGYNYIFLNNELVSDSVNGNHLLNYFSEIVEADIYFQLFVTAPFLSLSTVEKSIYLLENDTNYDSILTSNSIYSWFWFNNEPVNYVPERLPRSQDATPIIRETTGLYGIRKEILSSKKCRIGEKPYFLEVNEIESIDIDTNFDFQFAEYILKTNYHAEK